MNGGLDTRLQSAVTLHSQGQPEQAALLYAEILQAHPDHPDALHLLGVTETQLGRPRTGLNWIMRSLAINPNQPAAIANRGNAYLALEESAQALACYEQALGYWPDYVAAIYGRGNALLSLGKPIDALTCFERVLELAPHFAEALLACGAVLSKLQRHTEALVIYERAIARSPGSAQAHLGRAAALRALKTFNEAQASVEQAMRLAPARAEVFVERGHLMSEMGRTDAAIDAYQRALQLNPTLAAVSFSCGIALSMQGRYREAAESLQRAQQLDPDLPFARGACLRAELQVCGWHNYAAGVAAILDGLQRDELVDFPLALLAYCDSPSLQLKCAQQFTALQRAELKPLPSAARRANPRIRIAYVSADFLEHPTSYLMAGVFEKHDRHRFEVLGVSLRDERQPSPTARRVKAAMDRCVSGESLPDEALVRLLRELEIDVAVDLMGYTGEHRARIFGYRPAPVQVSYLGFPATMGSPDIDYLIADEFLIPEAERPGYGESIAYLPDCFQANDDRRPTATRMPTRQHSKLPASGLVMCSLHSSYKINPAVFDIWCRLLLAVPGGVLWLLGGNETLEQNLRREALARGVSPDRVVFASPLSYPEHLARLQLADLCLDTLPFNGGTTTSDALWAGVPVVTCAGKVFAARMSGSLLHALGLPELVSSSLEEYERLALQLARNPARLAALRAALVQQRRSSPLFDTERFCRHLEAAYATMVERQRSGLAPASFRVPALTR